ncbi:PfkB family carbohydrate kinase [Marinobacter sp.]|uniref:PfkB family carbohydrate kinase n=1 Tax=Marinobacter sp. TaxID=50741 RepID=UPI000C961A92|nr:hypothetical protein [Marinobacter sp.]
MKALVIGESCIDKFIYGAANRMAPEAPAPVIVPHREVCSPGMAANVAQNLRALGATVDHLSNPNKIEKTRYVDDKTNHLLLRIDTGDADTQAMHPITKYYKDLNQYDVIVISDYCKGFITEDDILMISNMHDNVFVDTKKRINECFKNVRCLKINEHEYESSKDYIDEDSDLKKKTVVTLGKLGCRLNNKIFSVPEVEVKDQVGAGDTFLAGLAYRFTLTKDMPDAIIYANQCATKVVSRRGTVSL